VLHSRNSSAWTAADVAALTAAVRSGAHTGPSGAVDWKAIAAETAQFGGMRLPAELRKRWTTEVNKTSRKWTEQEVEDMVRYAAANVSHSGRICWKGVDASGGAEGGAEGAGAAAGVPSLRGRSRGELSKKLSQIRASQSKHQEQSVDKLVPGLDHFYFAS
jgi:hypothetical protein